MEQQLMQRRIGSTTTAAVLAFELMTSVVSPVWSDWSLAGGLPFTQQSTTYFDRFFAEPGSSTVTAGLAGIPTLRQTTAQLVDSRSRSSGSANEDDLPNTGALIREVQERSGLTYQQLAKALGVSRRTLYLWANGGTMSAAHSESLARFDALVREHDAGEPSATRLALLRSDADGLSAFDRFRVERDAASPEITDFPLSASKLLAPNVPDTQTV
ncbi:MAG: helix-turn-helix domain-containing protein [Bifidobacterium tibiigranuli]|jgi:transcriptional regulator with XRE-family HTH domain|nr:helix-turn-helix domain-containing protein [Bifidobacterium tibiigranuli]